MEKKNNATKSQETKMAQQTTVENPSQAQPQSETKKVSFRNPFIGVAKEERRERFKELASNLKEQAKIAGIASSTNRLLLDYYKNVCGAPVLRTLEEWNAQGKRVKKGSEPFILWGAQQKVGEGDDERTFFPMKFVFDIHQVVSVEMAHE